MDFIKFFRAAMSRCLLGLIIVTLLSNPAYPLDSQDSQIFISGFNAYQKKDYRAAIDKMSQVLHKYPDTPLRDMAIFWLARAYFKAGNQQEAARYMAQFLKEYPDSPLKGTVEDELVKLATAYEKGEKLPVTAENAEQERIAAEKAAAEKARVAEEKAAREKAEAELAAKKADAERIAAENARLAAEKAAKEKAEAELAAKKAEAERLAAEKAAAEKARLAEEKAARERAEAERLVKEKAEAERIAIAQAVAENARLAAEKAAREKAEAERLAREKAEAERAAKKAEAERIAAEKSAAEKARLAEAKAAKQKAEAERLAAQKAEAERLAAERAAAEKVAQPVADVSGKKAQTAKKKEGRRTSSRSTALKEKAIEEYKAVIDRFPGTSAAASASVKLKEMGIVYPAAGEGTVPVAGATAPGENAQVLNLEVGQFADVDFTVLPSGQAYEVGKRFPVPFEVVNRGNGADSFYLESGFPAEFSVQFAAAGRPDLPINMTPSLAPGEKFQGTLAVTVPPGYIDGARIVYPVKLASQFARDVSQSREVRLIASAPLLRAVLKADRTQLLPGGKVTYRIALLNVGAAAARGVTFRLNYPPQYEPVDYIPAGFKLEMKAALVLDGLQISSGESREFNVTFQLKEEALAQQELFVRGEVINNDLRTRDSFISTATLVQAVSGVAVRASAERLVVIPGQTVAIPLIVTNTGNVREDFTIKPSVPGNLTYTFYQDLNRDGVRQANEPMINHVGPLAPREESYVVMEVTTLPAEKDGTDAQLALAFASELDRAKNGVVNIRLLYSRPVVELVMTGKGGRLRPGEVSSLDLNCFNRGSNMAKVVEVESILPYPLELVASDPAYAGGKNGEYIWKFEELGPGEKRSIKVTFRVKSGAAVGTNIQLKNVLKYQDQLGNRY
ncbi:MAG: pentapeptide repeat-containing [Geobacteraceae bacterium]|nr:MAG: pentapeptide repeat-containing [Geobacteraceae bacterium]